MDGVSYAKVYDHPPIMTVDDFAEVLSWGGLSVRASADSILIANQVNVEPMRYIGHSEDRIESYADGHLFPGATAYCLHHFRNKGYFPSQTEIDAVILHDTLEDWNKDNAYFVSREELANTIRFVCGSDVLEMVLLLSHFEPISDYEMLSRLQGDWRLLNMKYCDRLIGARAKGVDAYGRVSSRNLERAHNYLDFSANAPVFPSLIKEFKEEIAFMEERKSMLHTFRAKGFFHKPRRTLDALSQPRYPQKNTETEHQGYTQFLWHEVEEEFG